VDEQRPFRHAPALDKKGHRFAAAVGFFPCIRRRNFGR
jgi:hypothetical protein